MYRSINCMYYNKDLMNNTKYHYAHLTILTRKKNKLEGISLH